MFLSIDGYLLLSNKYPRFQVFNYYNSYAICMAYFKRQDNKYTLAESDPVIIPYKATNCLYATLYGIKGLLSAKFLRAGYNNL